MHLSNPVKFKRLVLWTAIIASSQANLSKSIQDLINWPFPTQVTASLFTQLIPFLLIQRMKMVSVYWAKNITTIHIRLMQVCCMKDLNMANDHQMYCNCFCTYWKSRVLIWSLVVISCYRMMMLMRGLDWWEYVLSHPLSVVCRQPEGGEENLRKHEAK